MAEISVIIPVYNKEEYLETCIYSISKQAVRDIEIILVDDGSTLSCSNACDKFAAADDRIKVIHQVNGGPAKARNAGIKCASGKYIIFVDSDDMLNEDTLEGLIDIINGQSPDVIISNVEYVNERKKRYNINTDISDTALINMGGADAVVEYFKDKSYFWPNVRFIIKRDFFLANNLFFFEGIRSQEDIEWVPRLISSASTFRLFPKRFYKYILRENTVSSRESFTKYRDLMKISENLWNNSKKAVGVRRAYMVLGAALCIQMTAEKYFGFEKQEKKIFKEWFRLNTFATEVMKTKKIAAIIIKLLGVWTGLIVYSFLAVIKGKIVEAVNNEK